MTCIKRWRQRSKCLMMLFGFWKFCRSWKQPSQVVIKKVGTTVFKLAAPISPVSNLSSTSSTVDLGLSTVEANDYGNPFPESSLNAQNEVPSVLSTLPVALVVEQTARILEDIKKKIQQQKAEEEQLRQLQSQWHNSDEKLADISKSFVVLKHETKDNTGTSNASRREFLPRTLSPDSGTAEQFSASSSISPPYLTSHTHNNSLLYQNSDDEMFKPLLAFSSFVPTTLANVSARTSSGWVTQPGKANCDVPSDPR